MFNAAFILDGYNLQWVVLSLWCFMQASKSYVGLLVVSSMISVMFLWWVMYARSFSCFFNDFCNVLMIGYEC